MAASLAYLGRLDEAREVLERAGSQLQTRVISKDRPGCGRRIMRCGWRAGGGR